MNIGIVGIGYVGLILDVKDKVYTRDIFFNN